MPNHTPAQLPDYNTLHDLLAYNPHTGVVTYKVSRGSKKTGSLAGYVDKGRRRVVIQRKPYELARVIYKMQTGEDTALWVDHIDGDALNNRWDNLRLVTPNQNIQNRRRRDGKLPGVYLNGSKWASRVIYKGKAYVTSGFPTAEAAHEHYCQRKNELCGEHSPYIS